MRGKSNAIYRFYTEILVCWTRLHFDKHLNAYMYLKGYIVVCEEKLV